MRISKPELNLTTNLIKLHDVQLASASEKSTKNHMSNSIDKELHL
jgi:hypothetical protein